MTNTSVNLQDLRRKIYVKAKAEKHWKFWGLYCHICKPEVLREAYRLAKANDGAAGIDGKSFKDIEAEGLEGFLEQVRQELHARTYRPMPNRRVAIPKGNGKTRTLGIPTIKDRVVQGLLPILAPMHRESPLSRTLQILISDMRTALVFLTCLTRTPGCQPI